MSHLFSRAAASIACCLWFALFASAITLDGTFGTGGKFTTSFAATGNPSSSGRWIHVQPSGRIVVVGGHFQQGTSGNMSGVAIAGLTTAGILDGGFANGGKVLIWTADANQPVADSAMLPDGSILVLHQFMQLPSTTRPVLVKFTPSGQPDPSFSANLEVTLNATSPVKLALAADGKIYALVRQANGSFNLLRLNANGSRDSTFGPEGVRDLNLSRIPTSQRTIASMHALADGKILITGDFSYTQTFYEYAFAVRFDTDTNLDRTFGRQGVVQISIPDGSVGTQRSIVQPDGKLILGGYFTFLGSNALMIRLTTRGRFDASFGNAGVVMTSFNNVNLINGLFVAADGKITVAGTSSAKAVPPNQRLVVARFSASGVRESFLVTNFFTNRDAGGNDVALQPDGKIVATGHTQNEGDNFLQLAVARFLP